MSSIDAKILEAQTRNIQSKPFRARLDGCRAALSRAEARRDDAAEKMLEAKRIVAEAEALVTIRKNELMELEQQLALQKSDTEADGSPGIESVARDRRLSSAGDGAGHIYRGFAVDACLRFRPWPLTPAVQAAQGGSAAEPAAPPCGSDDVEVTGDRRKRKDAQEDGPFMGRPTRRLTCKSTVSTDGYEDTISAAGDPQGL
jgi:hypothetical protein